MQLWTKIVLTSLVALPISLMAQSGDKRTLSSGVKKTSTSQSGMPGPNDSYIDSSQDSASSKAAPTKGAAAQPQSNSLPWMTDYAMGMQKAKKEHKPVFLYFTGSDWCGWCKKLDQEVFSQSDFAQAMSGKFVFIKLDFPMNRAGSDAEMQQNAKLKQQYGVTGFPTVVLLDSNGNFVAETGYRSGGPRAYASYIDQLMRSPNS